ncbi:hypothetical protein [Streptomyces sp. NPDC059479]|uniref:hypothetical protein n=1 Tax=Streptomyces sp. NPDC059479 TaxID=3346848 RepID=UPI0036CCD2FD
MGAIEGLRFQGREMTWLGLPAVEAGKQGVMEKDGDTGGDGDGENQVVMGLVMGRDLLLFRLLGVVGLLHVGLRRGTHSVQL